MGRPGSRSSGGSSSRVVVARWRADGNHAAIVRLHLPDDPEIVFMRNDLTSLRDLNQIPDLHRAAEMERHSPQAVHDITAAR
jgi:hypothetical protein